MSVVARSSSSSEDEDREEEIADTEIGSNKFEILRTSNSDPGPLSSLEERMPPAEEGVGVPAMAKNQKSVLHGTSMKCKDGESSLVSRTLEAADDNFEVPKYQKKKAKKVTFTGVHPPYSDAMEEFLNFILQGGLVNVGFTDLLQSNSVENLDELLTVVPKLVTVDQNNGVQLSSGV
ncbi:unnamed protein product [Dovyalis caffra]|uniref:Uncharacterized protein n=1 Tax=Dovyalis caffra TaxID=77055 RepID=A0AAV1RNV6_9ROSI|nr:unnamed protein product [Dovyalis caffra]